MKVKSKQCAQCKQMRPVFKNHTVDGVRLQFCSHGCFLLYTADVTITVPRPKQNKPIQKLSAKQAKIQAAYLKLRLDYLNEHPYCEFNFPGCTGSATDVHHTEGRGKNTTNKSTFKAICRNCHNYGHFKEPLLAKENGF